MKKKILVIEDDKRINDIVCEYLKAADYETFGATDSVVGLELFYQEEIDLVILDIMMPRLDGWSVCRRIRKKSDVIIIILSARCDEDDKLMGFELGADEYVTKPFSPKVLVARVNALITRLKNENLINDGIIQKGLICINQKSYTVTAGGNKLSLTAKEYKILLTLAINENMVFSRESLIQKIWGYDYFGDGRVVDTNVKTLRKKLGDLSGSIVTVIGVGYKFEKINSEVKV